MKKEKNLTTKEINKNKIQRLRSVLSFGETFLITVGFLIVGMAIIVGVLVSLSEEETSITAEMSEMTGMSEIANIESEDPADGIITIIFSGLGYALNILIIDKVRKILMNIEKDETPFTENNIVMLNKIKRIAIISFVTVLLGNEFAIGLIPLIIILALVFVFEHGCELQKEVDETL